MVTEKEIFEYYKLHFGTMDVSQIAAHFGIDVMRMLDIVRYEQDLRTKKLIAWNRDWTRKDPEAFVVNLAHEIKEMGYKSNNITEQLLDCFRSIRNRK